MKHTDPKTTRVWQVATIAKTIEALDLAARRLDDDAASKYCHPASPLRASLMSRRQNLRETIRTLEKHLAGIRGFETSPRTMSFEAKSHDPLNSSQK
jgi:hypothetical protein